MQRRVSALRTLEDCQVVLGSMTAEDRAIAAVLYPGPKEEPYRHPSWVPALRDPGGCLAPEFGGI